MRAEPTKKPPAQPAVLDVFPVGCAMTNGEDVDSVIVGAVHHDIWCVGDYELSCVVANSGSSQQREDSQPVDAGPDLLNES